MTASILALTVSLAACKKKDGGTVEKKEEAKPIPVQVAVAAEGDSLKQIVLTGTIVADQRSEVTADTAGKILSVRVERGDRVKMGQPVVQLDVQSAALGAREAQANLANARVQRELAEQECARTKQLLDKGAITRSEYDRQTTQCSSALQLVSAAEARAQMMMKTVADGIVRAPFDGLVAQKSVSVGEFVSPGRPLFTLVDDDPLRIELSVPESEVNAIKLGQDVLLTAVSARDKSYKAKVTRVGAEIGRSRALIVEATLEPGSGLVPGMFAEATLTVGTDKHPVVPKAAVVDRGKRKHVFVLKNFKDASAAPAKPVEPGKDAKDAKAAKPAKAAPGKTAELEDRIVQIAPTADPATLAILQNVKPDEQVVVVDEAEQKALAKKIEAKKKAIEKMDSDFAETHKNETDKKKLDEAKKALQEQKKPLLAEVEALENQLITDGRRVEVQ
jgi:membrane fusion protein (multidrug efflux system)